MSNKTNLTKEGKFATRLEPDSYMVALLWRQNNTEAAAIIIEKEILTNANNGTQHLAFHVYNCTDRSLSDDYRVNPPEKPFLSFAEALKVAEEHIGLAKKNGEWSTNTQKE